jgi:hypothetical protein
VQDFTYGDVIEVTGFHEKLSQNMSDFVTPNVEQRYVITFLVKDEMKADEIPHGLSAQYGRKALSCTSML